LKETLQFNINFNTVQPLEFCYLTVRTRMSCHSLNMHARHCFIPYCWDLVTSYIVSAIGFAAVRTSSAFLIRDVSTDIST
jgi:hypothetical protein